MTVQLTRTTLLAATPTTQHQRRPLHAVAYQAAMTPAIATSAVARPGQTPAVRPRNPIFQINLQRHPSFVSSPGLSNKGVRSRLRAIYPYSLGLARLKSAQKPHGCLGKPPIPRNANLPGLRHVCELGDEYSCVIDDAPDFIPRDV